MSHSGAQVRLRTRTLPGNDLKQVVHTRDSVTKQYNLVPVKGRWCPEAGKVTVGLASHWPCITDSSGLSTYELNGREWEMSTPPTPQWGMADFTMKLTTITTTDLGAVAGKFWVVFLVEVVECPHVLAVADEPVDWREMFTLSQLLVQTPEHLDYTEGCRRDRVREITTRRRHPAEHSQFTPFQRLLHQSGKVCRSQH